MATLEPGVVYEFSWFATAPRIERHLSIGHNAEWMRTSIIGNMQRPHRIPGSDAAQPANPRAEFGTVHRLVIDTVGTSGPVRISAVMCMTPTVAIDTRALDGQILASLNWQSGVTEEDAIRVNIDANAIPPWSGVVKDDTIVRLSNPSESTRNPNGAASTINRVLSLPTTRTSSQRNRDQRTGAGLAVEGAAQTAQNGLRTVAAQAGPAMNALGRGVGGALSSAGQGLMAGLGIPSGVVTAVAIGGGIVGGILLLSVAYRVAKSNVK